MTDFTGQSAATTRASTARSHESTVGDDVSTVLTVLQRHPGADGAAARRAHWTAQGWSAARLRVAMDALAELEVLRAMSAPILTDGAGVPFERPVPPAADAPLEVKLAHIRAVHAHNDAVTDCGNAAFARGFLAGAL